MPYDFDRLIPRTGTDSVKWDRYKSGDVIPMWVADMDFQSPAVILDALHSRVDHGVFGYTRTPEELNGVVVDMLDRKYGWPVDPQWLIWLPGIVTGLNIACRAVGVSCLR